MKKHIFLAALFLTACQSDAHIESTHFQGINGLQAAHIEVATTDEQHQVGLMNRAQMLDDHGMLFVFNNNGNACFWMKNTLIPLTVGFIDEQGVLQQTVDMQAQTTDPHCPNLPYRYALEMNQGWFARQHINIGTPILRIK